MDSPDATGMYVPGEGQLQMDRAVPESFEMEACVMDKDGHFAQVQLQEERRFENYAEKTQKLIHSIRTEVVAAKHFDDLTTAGLATTEEKVKEDLNGMRQWRHGVETQMERLVEAKIVDGRSSLGEEIQAREKSQTYTKEIGAEICNLYADIDQARQFRTEKGKKLVAGVDSKFTEIRDAISAEQRIREDSENTMLEMLQDMGMKMQNELDAAKLERRKSQERLVQLMEKILPQMCSNLQQRGNTQSNQVIKALQSSSGFSMGQSNYA